MQGAPAGVQGLLEDAGYLVYAPTLPYHAPNTQWSPNQGELKAQDYVDYLKLVRYQITVKWTTLPISAAERIGVQYNAIRVMTERLSLILLLQVPDAMIGCTLPIQAQKKHPCIQL